MTDVPTQLLDAARQARPSPQHREAQRRSFAYGHTHFENGLITRQMVDRQADKLAKELGEHGRG